jgi:HEPN domain-containing protein
MESAEYNFQGGRNLYAVFMCHLSIEKALKGIIHKRTSQFPPKGHHLMSLVKKAGVTPTADTSVFLARLNEADVATRYPDDLAQINRVYTEAVTQNIIEQGKELLKWIKAQF